MKIFNNEKLVYYAVENDSQLPMFHPSYPFKALVIIDREIAKEVRFAWADWFVENPCRYLSAWGVDCSKWDDDVDKSVVIKKIFLEQSNVALWQGVALDDYHIMTAWHEQETLDEVIDFVLRADEFDEQKIEWVWLIDFYNDKNRFPVLEKFLHQFTQHNLH